VTHARLSEIDGGLLLTLQALLREANVTRAAEALSLSQPTVSGRLARLRAVFDDPLLVPSTTGRGMVPTELAVQLRPQVAAALQAMEQLLTPRRPFDPETSGRRFVIAIPENPAVMLMPDLIPRLQRQAPHLRVASVLPDRTSLAEDLEAGRVDLLIDAEGDVPDDWMMRPLLQERFATAQRRGHPRGVAPLTLDQFCAGDHILISADGGSFSGLVDGALAELGRQRRVTVSVQSYALAPLILAQSDGFCTLPRRLLARFGGDLDVFAPPLDLPPIRIALHWHARSRHDAGHAWLRDQIVSAATAVDQSGSIG